MTKKDFVRWLAYGAGRFMIGLCEFGGRVVPLPFLYAFGNFIAFCGYTFAFKHRKIAIESLTMAFGDTKTPQEIKQIAKDCFKSMSGLAVEFFMFMRHPERIHKFVDIEGLENLKAALARGKGVVAVSAHFGSFPLLLSRLSQEGYKTHAILRHMRDKGLDKLFEEKRDFMNVASIYTQPRETCVTQSLQALRNNDILFVQLDQNFGTAGVFVDFFGVKAATATGPVVFSMRTGAPLVPMFIYRVKGPRHHFMIEPGIDVKEDGKDKDEVILDTVSKLTGIIERYIRKYPHEWGWIHKRWKARPKEEKNNA